MRRPANPFRSRSAYPSPVDTRSRTDQTRGIGSRLVDAPRFTWQALVMRIHVQNPPDDPLGPISPVMWDQAALRAGEVGLGHAVSFGQTPAAFADAIAEA